MAEEFDQENDILPYEVRNTRKGKGRMMIGIAALVILIIIIAVAVSLGHENTETKTTQQVSASCYLQGSTVEGFIYFSQNYTEPGSPVKITGNITGLNDDTKHGFHIHEKGDITGGCISTGGHYNPKNKNHGAPSAAERHVGDLGNVKADAPGSPIILDLKDSIISLVGENSVIGRAVVLHSGEDDLGLGGNSGSTKTGNAGSRLGCCVIGLN